MMRYQSTRPKRQFLAGVKCPECRALDAVVQVRIFEPQPDEYIECTQCGHTERRPDASSIQQTATPASTQSVEVQPVRFVP